VRLPFDLALQVIQNIVAIELERKRGELTASDTTGSIQPLLPPLRQRQKLLIDANLVGYKHLCSKSTFSPHQAVMHIAKTCAEKHCDVVIAPIIQRTAIHPNEQLASEELIM
jgi:hypothetical protein